MATGGNQTRTAFFGFKRKAAVTEESITDHLKSHGFTNFTIVLPMMPSFSNFHGSVLREKGFCFIRFKKREDVRRLVYTLDKTMFQGGTLKIAPKGDGENAYNSDSSHSGSDFEYEQGLDSD